MQTSFPDLPCGRLSRTALSLALGAALAALACAKASAADTTTLAPVVVTGSNESTSSWAQWQSTLDLAARRAATNDTASLLLGLPGLSVNAAGGVSGLPQY
ncbi:MAG: TonB-dependent receptor, partial [Thiomonas sp.]